MDLIEIKRIIDEQGEAFDKFKQANDDLIKAKAEGKGGRRPRRPRSPR